MPMPYAHLAVAHGVLQRINRAPSNDYYLGAFMPDIRYFTKQPRETTHFSIERLHELAASMHVPAAFVLGYRVHLLIDEQWEAPGFTEQYRTAFPSFIRERVAKRLQVVFELYTLHQHPVAIKLRAEENELTKLLGVQKEQVETAIGYLQTYLDQRSLQAGFAIAQASGMFPPTRIAEMQRVGRLIECNPLARWVVFTLINRVSKAAYDRLVAAIVARA